MSLIKQCIQKYEEYKAQNLVFGLYEELEEPMQYLLALGGKSLRPASVMFTHQLLRNSLDTHAYAIAHGVEIFHNFTLMHDDIMDVATKRRGSPSVHLKFSESKAILSGDAMMMIALRYLYQTPKNISEIIVPYFVEIGLKICEGQSMDMAFEQRSEVSISEYIEMIRLKTSVLFGACFYMGAISAQQSIAVAEKLYQFGEQLGIAFQIQDDVMDVFGNVQSVGKRSAGDIWQKKKTILYLSLMEVALDHNEQQLLQLYNSTAPMTYESVNRVQELMQKYDIEMRAQKLLAKHYQSALNQLKDVGFAEEQKNHFLELTHQLIKRLK